MTNENNPEGGDGSESASPTIYVCRYCKTDWETELDANRCEQFHEDNDKWENSK